MINFGELRLRYKGSIKTTLKDKIILSGSPIFLLGFECLIKSRRGIIQRVLRLQLREAILFW